MPFTQVVSRLWEGICKDERHVVDEDTVHIQQARSGGSMAGIGVFWRSGGVRDSLKGGGWGGGAKLGWMKGGQMNLTKKAGEEPQFNTGEQNASFKLNRAELGKKCGKKKQTNHRQSQRRGAYWRKTAPL